MKQKIAKGAKKRTFASFCLLLNAVQSVSGFFHAYNSDSSATLCLEPTSTFSAEAQGAKFLEKPHILPMPDRFHLGMKVGFADPFSASRGKILTAGTALQTLAAARPAFKLPRRFSRQPCRAATSASSIPHKSLWRLCGRRSGRELRIPRGGVDAGRAGGVGGR
ncbi:MAG: hypothetical protein U1F87_08060 [Kiritimatiellia bacterium]